MRAYLQPLLFLSRYLAFFSFSLYYPALISAFSITQRSKQPSSIGANVQCSWESELWEIAKPLSPAPPSLCESLEVLKRDGVVRLNIEAFRVEENLCAALRDRILAEIETPDAGDSIVDFNFTDKYIPGTRIRPGERAVDIAFGGYARHDVLLPLNDENFSELRPVLESAARQLKHLLLVAVEQLLPRMHGSYNSASGWQRNTNDEENKVPVHPTSRLQRQVVKDKLSAELVEVGSLVVRQGSEHQSVHGDYRRFNERQDDKQEVESLINTKARYGKMPPRIVTFVALQDIPSDEHGSTGFITGTHNSYAHGLIYGESTKINDTNKLSTNRRNVLRSSTSGVRTSCGFRRGEMLIYDASVLHWGGANTIPKNNRAILYFGISRLESAALLSQSQPTLKGFEIVQPILLQDIIASI